MFHVKHFFMGNLRRLDWENGVEKYAMAESDRASGSNSGWTGRDVGDHGRWTGRGGEPYGSRMGRGVWKWAAGLSGAVSRSCPGMGDESSASRRSAEPGGRTGDLPRSEREPGRLCSWDSWQRPSPGVGVDSAVGGCMAPFHSHRGHSGRYPLPVSPNGRRGPRPCPGRADAPDYLM